MENHQANHERNEREKRSEDALSVASKITITTILRRGINFVSHKFAPGYMVQIIDGRGAELPRTSYQLRQKFETLEVEFNFENDTPVTITIIG